MPRIMHTTVFTFDELTDAAKEKARDWWRQSEMETADLSDTVNDCLEIFDMIGLTLKTRNVNYVVKGGKTRSASEPCFYYSGFSSQGDGASFEGRYEFVAGFAGAVKKDRPTDTRLHALVDRLQALQVKHHRRLTGWVCQNDSRYVHSNTMTTGIARSNTSGDFCRNIEGADSDDFKSIMRGLADWAYKALESDYESRFEQEYIDENIIANEYEFTAEGKIV